MTFSVLLCYERKRTKNRRGKNKEEEKITAAKYNGLPYWAAMKTISKEDRDAFLESWYRPAPSERR